MKKLIATLIMVTTLSLSVVGIAHSATIVSADTYVGSGSSANTAFGTTDPDNLELNSGGLGVCSATRTIYLRWLLSGVNSVVGKDTRMELTVNNAQASSTGQITLFKVNDDEWNEATLTQNSPAPSLGASIMSVANPTGTGTVVFEGQALADWINENSSHTSPDDPIAGNDKVSFALQITGCTGFSNPTRFDSKDKVGGSGPELYSFGPTYVALSTFTTQGVAITWPLYAGLAAVALLAVAGVGLSRRRASLR